MNTKKFSLSVSIRTSPATEDGGGNEGEEEIGLEIFIELGSQIS